MQLVYSVREITIVFLSYFTVRENEGGTVHGLCFSMVNVSSVTSLNCALIKLNTYRFNSDFHPRNYKRTKRTAVLEIQLIVKHLSIIGLLSLPQLLMEMSV